MSQTIHLGMGKIPHKNGDDWGMVWNCLTHMNGIYWDLPEIMMEYTYTYTIWLFNIAMENHNF